ncbi:MAG: ribosomal protein S18-alanine N-acetyltransferase [Rhodoferax sp.]|nr:ribosomal protein S18-alanine N-acetyltransferase [Actinomycetota bacterium]
MRWWDVQTLAALERELFTADAWTAETWWAELAQAPRWYCAVELPERPGEPAGYAGAAVNGPDADVMTVAVAPWAQGRGLGGQLLSALVVAVAERGAARLVLEVRADNVVAQRLYARHGFERIAVRRGYYDGVDAWIMRRRPVRAVDSLVS